MLSKQLARLVDQISTIIVGKRRQIEDCVACLLAGGHLIALAQPRLVADYLLHASV